MQGYTHSPALSYFSPIIIKFQIMQDYVKKNSSQIYTTKCLHGCNGISQSYTFIYVKILWHDSQNLLGWMSVRIECELW